VRNGVLDPRPVAGAPTVKAAGVAGLMDVVLHPQFAENKFIYFTYHKARSDASDPNGPGIITLARGRWDGNAVTELKDIFTTFPDRNASRIIFGRDGKLYMTVGIGDMPGAPGAQDPKSYAGKVLRLNDDGSVPKDNPFVGQVAYRPEIYTM